MVLTPGESHDGETVNPEASASLVGFPSSSLSTVRSKSHCIDAICPRRFAVADPSSRMESPMDTVESLESETFGVNGGASSIRTVMRRSCVPFPPPRGTSVLSTTKSSSSPSRSLGTIHVTDLGTSTPCRAPPSMYCTPTAPNS